MRKKACLITLMIAFSFVGALSQPKTFNTYRNLTSMQMASPGAFKFGLYGFSNPAMLEYVTAPFDMQVSVNTNNDVAFMSGAAEVNNWGIFSNIGNTGVGAFTSRTADGSWVTEYRLSTTAGTKELSWGFGYGFSGENKAEAGFSNMYNLGVLYRPFEELSIGVVYTDALESSFNESVVDIAVRPVGDWPMTLYADYSYATVGEDWGDVAALGGRNSLGTWSAGASLEFPFLPGVRFNGRYIDSEIDAMDMTMIGLEASIFNGLGFGQQFFSPEFGDDFSSNTTHFRLGAWDRSPVDLISFMDNYVKLDLSGAITYRPFQLFDSRNSLMDILRTIDRAAKDDEVSGLFINAVNMGGSYAMKWEIREKLKEFKEEYGKGVVIFIERVGIPDYHFATVADRIVMDEMGSAALNGFMAGRSYYENMFDKIGIGFTELRFLKYKSALESFSRTGFSEGDKEQREAYINDWYDIFKEDVLAARDISDEDFEGIINNQIQQRAEELKDAGLIDALGRWNMLDDMAEELAVGDYDATVPEEILYKASEPIDDQWSLGEDLLAVIYADGVCAMEGGINARTLWKYVERAVENPNVGAIVLRVDSPGGDALASEYIAKILRENKDKKPIIVSQGMLAASGGYWLSMDADEIYTTPMTITGSIGVISGWIYDDGLQDTLGITTDHVQVGRFADLGFAWNDPLIGIGLPIRDLNEAEEELRKEEILYLYDQFIEHVAEGRDMEEEDVREVAQGRVWTGRRALGLNLVDKIGGLSAAIDRAKELMETDNEDDVIIVEYPPRGDIDFKNLVPMLLPINTKTISEKVAKANFLFENNGTAMPILPLNWQDDPNFDNKGKSDSK
jgi:protease-4